MKLPNKPFFPLLLLLLVNASGCGWVSFKVTATSDSNATASQSDANTSETSESSTLGVGIKNSDQLYQQISDGLTEGLKSYNDLLVATVSAANRYSAKQLHQSVKSSLPQSSTDSPTSDVLMSLVRFSAGSCFYAVQGEARLSASSTSRNFLKNIDTNNPTQETVMTVMNRLAVIFWKHELTDEEISALSPLTTVRSGNSKTNFWTAICTVFAASIDY